MGSPEKLLILADEDNWNGYDKKPSQLCMCGPVYYDSLHLFSVYADLGVYIQHK